jgi:hypothetical protein
MKEFLGEPLDLIWTTSTNNKFHGRSRYFSESHWTQFRHPALIINFTEDQGVSRRAIGLNLDIQPYINQGNCNPIHHGCPCSPTFRPTQCPPIIQEHLWGSCPPSDPQKKSCSSGKEHYNSEGHPKVQCRSERWFPCIHKQRSQIGPRICEMFDYYSYYLLANERI